MIPDCTKCSQNIVATYSQVVWECPSVSNLCAKVAKCFENILNFLISNQPTLFVFNHNSVLSDSTRLVVRKIIFAGLTAAKKDHNTVMVLPKPLSIKEWLNHLRDNAVIDS